MSTVAQRISSGVRMVERLAQRIEAFLRYRGQAVRDLPGDQCGRSESIDPDNVGDIADEGAGHRG